MENYINSSDISARGIRRHLEGQERDRLEKQGCRADRWEDVEISGSTSLDAIHDVDFAGPVSIGALSRADGSVLERTRLKNVVLGDNVTIRDVALLEFEPEAPCGFGTEVAVLDESGSRPVFIYPGLSAQTALLMAREPAWCENYLRPILSDYFETMSVAPYIGDNARVERCGLLMNVAVGRGITVEGAESLRNGMIINNSTANKPLAYVGAGVNAENFIVEDGRLDSGAVIRNCFIGQGASVEKQFSAHDSLFFANTQVENGEACAVFAGPYTVSMHKSSLLIGCQTSFMNAGSGTNQSNHMYKLGPVHWGILERGVKTSSDSYLMLGAKIGAFSMLMGQHKTHPDSSQFPFSYLFGDEKGATVVVPGVMLRSCGLMRDEKKWPARDRRLKRRLPIHDRIVFDVLNPLTVEKMLSASDVIDALLNKPADDDRYVRYRGMKFTRASLERAKFLYTLGIYKYLDLHIDETGFLYREPGHISAEWVDMAGLPVPRTCLKRVKRAESIEEIERVFDEAFNHYRNLERAWIASRFDDKWRKPKAVISEFASQFDKMVEEDRARYLEDLAAQNAMLAF